MRIAIISAMPEEISGIHTLGLPLKKEVFAGREFFHTQINQTECILATTRIGKVAAAQTVSALMTRYEPSHVIMIGSAGALHNELDVGDIVIGDQLFQHDVDLRPFRPRFELGFSGKTFFQADGFLMQSALEASKNFIQSAAFDAYQKKLNAFNIVKPKVMQGSITSGDIFFSSHHEHYRNELCTTMPGLLATEMEGAAIAQVCDDFQVPFIVVRFISDRARPFRFGRFHDISFRNRRMVWERDYWAFVEDTCLDEPYLR